MAKKQQDALPLLSAYEIGNFSYEVYGTFGDVPKHERPTDTTIISAIERFPEGTTQLEMSYNGVVYDFEVKVSENPKSDTEGVEVDGEPAQEITGSDQ